MRITAFPRVLINLTFLSCVIFLAPMAWGGDGNRLTHLDEFCDPYQVGLNTAKLTVPQWVGEPGFEAVVVLAIDDMHSVEPIETHLRPILKRLQDIDGRAPLSIMTNEIDTKHPHLQKWLGEGLSIEAHTTQHRCPCLQGGGGGLAASKKSFDASVDLVSAIANNPAVAFRMPCCDSMSSVSPRFFSEVFNKTTPKGNFLTVDTSVFNLFTSNDPALPRKLVRDANGQEKFAKYVSSQRGDVNVIDDYPYPYVIGRLCWELPCLMPSDWAGQNRNKPHSPITLADWKAAIDAAVIKQGAFSLCIHTHNWMDNDKVVELIDYAAKKGKVKFLSLAEVDDLLTRNVLGGQPLRAANGQDNGVRMLDLNGDGYMDAVVGNEKAHQTRIWSPQQGKWIVGKFPLPLVGVNHKGNRIDAGARFGILQKDGMASVLIRNEKIAGLWHFDGKQWVKDAKGLEGLELDGPILTSKIGIDRGVRLRDLDGDGICELIVGNEKQNAAFAWKDGGGWKKLPFGLPKGTSVVDAQGRDAGLRFVDIDEDGRDDVVFSNAQGYSLYVFSSLADGWSRRILESSREENDAIPMIVRSDGTNNGAWFARRHMYVQNEDTGGKLHGQIDSRFYTQLLAGDFRPPARSPQSSLGSMLIRPGYKMDLAVTEPLVMDPIDISWGPDGKAWVVEMTDYPTGIDGKGQPGGRVRYLQDTDGDGRYDKSTVFLEPIGFPTGAMPWRKGVIVTTAPEVFYAEDTNGDGKADLRRTLFSGFREGNQQHLVNHPRWGLDNWVYLANGDSDGEIRSAKSGEIMNISGRDLRIRPDSGLMDTQAGRTQFGRNRDDWGNWIGCTNNNAGWHYALADHYIRRNPYVAAPGVRKDLTSRRDVYPSGRVITHCFIPQPTPPEGQPGAWTCISSPAFYRDELFGPLFKNNTFVADAVYNAVHRMAVTPNGASFKGQRPPGEERSEFLCSADPWFRPCTVRTGPDGAIWVVDMYRFVIEHPEWIDIELAKTLNLREGHELGRIYRIYPIDKKPRAIPRLDKLDTAGLVAALDSPNGWQRDMAQQMLIWRADKSAVGPLEEMIKTNKRALARLHALCTLDGLSALRPEIATLALADKHAGVRRHAIRVSEPLLGKNPALGQALLKLVDDRDVQVRMQLAYSLGQWHNPAAGKALGRLAIDSRQDPYLSAAVMSSAVPHVSTMLEVAKAATNSPEVQTLVKRLEKLAADIEEEPELAEAAISNKGAATFTKPIEPSRERVEKVLGRSATVEQIQKSMNKYLPVIDMFGDPQRGKKIFVEATCSTCHKFKDIGERIGPDLETLNDRSPQNMIVSVIDPNRAILDRYVQHVAITTDGKTINGMLMEESSNSLTLAELDGKKKVVLRKDLDELLYTGRSFMPEGLEATLDLQQMADLFAFVGGRGVPPKKFPGNKPQTVYRGGDECFDLSAARAEIYGPDIRFQTKGQNLGNWTCPRAFAAWSFDNTRSQRLGNHHVVLDLASDASTAGSRFVVQLGNQRLNGVVPDTGGPNNYRRVHLGQVSFGRGRHRLSLRPDPTLDRSLMNLRGLRLVPEEAVPTMGFHNRPKKVLADPEGKFSLPATVAEVHGPGVAFELKYGNLGLWYDPRGYGAWSLRVERGGSFDVWLDWACMDAVAGNRFEVKIGDKTVSGQVDGTGNWDTYRQKRLGSIELKPGDQILTFRAEGTISGALIDLRGLQLVPAGEKPKWSRTQNPEAAVSAKPKLPQTETLTPLEAATDGSLTLTALAGRGIGPKIDYMPEWKAFGWIFADDRVEWQANLPRACKYDIWLEWSVGDDHAGKPYVFQIGEQKLEGTVPKTGSWETFQTAKIGSLDLPAGTLRPVFKAAGKFQGALLDLRQIRLVPSEK